MATIYKRPGETKWRIRYRTAELNAKGRRKRREAMGVTSKAETRRIAARLEDREELKRRGVIDEQAEAQAARHRESVEDNLTAYRAHLTAENYTPKHVKTVVDRVRAAAEYLGWATIGQINAEGADRYDTALKQRGLSDRTRQAHRAALKAFGYWLVGGEKLPGNPLRAKKGGRHRKGKIKRRLVRRMLLPEEWPHLQAAALAGPERYGLAGEDRVLLYELAIQTGLRAGELRSLARDDLRLSAAPPHVFLDGEHTKNGENARQYVTAELAKRLRAYIARKTPQAEVFALPQPKQVPRMLREDLGEARRAWLAEAIDDPKEYTRRRESDFLAETDHAGKRLDFHSLRHTCGAWLAMAGVPIKVVQGILRHSTITLTMDTYGHLYPGAEADAVAMFARYMGGADPVRTPFGVLIGAHPARPTCPGMTTPVTTSTGNLPGTNEPNPLTAQKVGDTRHRMAPSVA